MQDVTGFAEYPFPLRYQEAGSERNPFAKYVTSFGIEQKPLEQIHQR
jgi:hypothetical protein